MRRETEDRGAQETAGKRILVRSRDLKEVVVRHRKQEQNQGTETEGQRHRIKERRRESRQTGGIEHGKECGVSWFYVLGKVPREGGKREVSVCEAVGGRERVTEEERCVGYAHKHAF